MTLIFSHLLIQLNTQRYKEEMGDEGHSKKNCYFILKDISIHSDKINRTKQLCNYVETKEKFQI